MRDYMDKNTGVENFSDHTSGKFPAHKRKGFHIKAVLGVIIVLYPILIFCSLVIFKVKPKFLSGIIILVASFYMFFHGRTYRGKLKWTLFLCPVILFIIAVVCFFTNSRVALKLYPAIADLAYIFIFGMSFFIPPPIIYHFVLMLDSKAESKLPPEKIIRYCRDTTKVWCLFFLTDGLIALVTVLYGSDMVWGIYNGGLTYICMGLICAGNLIYYKLLCRKEERIKTV
jgi:uncharacterized membrane protein